MTSGSVSATASKSMPSFSSNRTGVLAPSSSSFFSTQGSTPSPSSSPKSAEAMPTGTTPRASGTSWLAQFTVATRFGFSLRVALPSACSTVSGNVPEDFPDDSADEVESFSAPSSPSPPASVGPPQAARVRSAAAVLNSRRRYERMMVRTPTVRMPGAGPRTYWVPGCRRGVCAPN